ncbi:Transmembrane protein 199 [Nymphon striatum]|nr:Transmembrane protein 199 [Nymphon striatum]
MDEPTGVQFKACDELIDEMQEVLQSKIIDAETEAFMSGDCVSLKVVKKIIHSYSKGSKKHSHELLSRLQIILPKPKIPPRNLELEKRIEKLKIEAASQEYRNMTKNVSIGETKSEINKLRSEVKIARSHLVSVMNFVLSVAGTFAFVFMAIGYASSTPNIAEQLIGGIIAATVVALSELYFLFVYHLN